MKCEVINTKVGPFAIRKELLSKMWQKKRLLTKDHLASYPPQWTTFSSYPSQVPLHIIHHFDAVEKTLQKTWLFSNWITPIHFSQKLLLRHKQAKSSENFGNFSCFKLQICIIAPIWHFLWKIPKSGMGNHKNPKRSYITLMKSVFQSEE